MGRDKDFKVIQVINEGESVELFEGETLEEVLEKAGDKGGLL